MINEFPAFQVWSTLLSLNFFEVFFKDRPIPFGVPSFFCFFSGATKRNTGLVVSLFFLLKGFVSLEKEEFLNFEKIKCSVTFPANKFWAKLIVSSFVENSKMDVGRFCSICFSRLCFWIPPFLKSEAFRSGTLNWAIFSRFE